MPVIPLFEVIIQMEQILSDIIEFLLPQNDLFLYAFLFISAIVENLFPPIPGDTITGLGAFLVGAGRLNYWLVYAATTLGSLLGFMTLFLLGRLLEREFFMKKNYSFLSARTIVSTEEWFRRHGYAVILINRFIPGIRSAVSLVSGISLLSPHRVALFAAISAAVWNLIWIQVGFTLGNNWELVKDKMMLILKSYNIIAGGILVLCLTVFIIFRIVRARLKSRNQNT